MAELGVGYISIVPEVSKISPGIAKALKASEGAADSTGVSMGSKISNKLGGALKKGGLAAGAAGGAAVAAGLTKGIGRLNSIEQAEAKLKGLGNSTQQVGSIMENALASVNGTAFGLEEAATTASSLVAAGIKPGQELEGVLTTVADTATIAGTSMADMGTIFGSVAARGKLQGDDMLQLLGRGVPVLQLLADETGKTSEEISDMVSKGEIDFATFERAMKRGMGGSAQEAGKTVQGAFKNMGAAAGRLGATIAGPFFTQAAGGFTGVTKALDALNGRMKPVMADMASWLTGTAVPALKDFGQQGVAAFRELWSTLQQHGVIDGTVTAFKQLWDAGVALAPAVASIGKSVAQASAALGVSAWTAFVGVLRAAGAVAEALAGPLEAVAGLMEDHPGLVVAAVAAWTAFKTVPGMITPITTALSNLAPKVAAAKTSFTNLGQGARDIQAYYSATGREISSLGAKMQYMASSSNKTLSSMGTAFVNAGGTATGFGNTLRGVASGAMAGMKSAAGGIVNALGGPWGAAMAGAGIAVSIAADSIQRLNSYQEASERLARTSATAYDDFFKTLVSGSGDLDMVSSKVGDVSSAFEQMGKSNDGFLAGTQRWGERINALVTAGGGLGNVINTWNLDKAADDAQGAADAMSDLGMSNDEVAQKIVGSAGNWQAFKDRLEGMGEGGKAAASRLQEFRDAHEQATAQVDRLGPAAANAASVLQELATTTGDAADRASKLRRAFMELRGVDVDATEAAADLTDQIDSLNDQMSSASGGASEFAGATLKANGSLDATTSSGSALYSALNELGDSMQRSVASGNDANEVFGQSAGALEQMRQQAGIGVDDWNRLLDVMGMTPEQMTITADVQSDAAKADLAAIANQIKGLGDEATQKPIPIKINDEEAKNKLEQAGFKLQDWNEKTGSANLDLTDAGAIERYNWWMSAGFPAIDTANPTAKANLDESGLLYKTEYAKMQLATLDLERPMPWADMNIGSLSAKQLEALQKVGILDGTTPTSDAYMNLSQFSPAQQEAMARVFNLDAQTPTPAANMDTSALNAAKSNADGQVANLDSQKANPKADLDNRGVFAGAEDAKKWIASIIGKTVTVTFKAVYQGFKDKLGLGGNSIGGFWNGPAYASGGRHGGYQLPTSGPGTDVTDGFLAFDKDNIPAARLDAGEWIINARSSKKYGKELREINNGTFQKLPGYADGGIAHADDIDRFARDLEGKPYVWGGVNWGDCSGAMSAIARFAVGMDPFGGRFATGNEASALQAMGFKMGRGSQGDLRIGWFNGGPWGGHTAGTLPNGINVEMGGGRGNGQYGGPAAGAWDSQFTDHAYLSVPTSYSITGVEGADAFAAPRDTTYSGDGATTASNSRTSSSTDSSPTSWSDVAGIAASNFAKGQVKDILGVFGIPDTPPALAAQKQWEDEKARYQEQVKGASDSGQTSSTNTSRNLDVPIVYDPSKGASQWTSTVEEALSRVGLAASNVQRTIDQIDIESGGDPNASNDWDSNAANGDPSKGLLQVIGSTFRAYRDQDLPDDQTHPLANIVAALNYVVDRYSGPESIWPTRAGYKRGGYTGDFGIDDVAGVVHGREFVVNAANTAKNLSLLQAMNSGLPAADLVSAASDVMSLMSSEGDVFAGLGKTSLSGLDAPSATSPSDSDRGSVSVTNNFTAANPDEMYRQYRRAAAKSHGGRIGAR